MQLQYVTLFPAVLFSTYIAAVGIPTSDDPISTLRLKIYTDNLTTPANPDTARILGSQLSLTNASSQSNEVYQNLTSPRSIYDSGGRNGDSVVKTLLRPRGADPFDYQALVNKGHDLLCLMNAKTETQARAFNQNRPVRSTFTEYNAIYRWGYEEAIYGTPSYETSLKPWNPFYPALDYVDSSGNQVAFDRSKNIDIAYCHFCVDNNNQPREVLNEAGEEIEATIAKFINVVNTANGAIIADDNLSPSANQYGIAVLPDLKYWSDVVFLQWEKFALDDGVDVKSLRFISRANVRNKDTKNAAVTIFNHLGLKYIPAFKNRLTWSMEEDGGPGQAILGTVNAAGCAYLLAQHKDQLGVKTFKSVQIWSSFDGDGWEVLGDIFYLTLYLVFEIEDVV